MRNTRLVLVAAVVTMALGLAACGGGGGGGTDSRPSAAGVTVTGTEFKFDPASITVPAGGTITFDNAGTVEHTFTVVGTSLSLTAKPGTTASAAVDLEPGTYEVVCATPGHLQSGMKGTLTID